MAALVGVLGATGICRSSTCLCTSSFVPLLPDTLRRAIGKQEYILHALLFFASRSTLVSTSGCVPRLSTCFIFDGALGTYPSLSMLIFKIPVVITTGGLWLVMMFLIDITNLIAQVCSSFPLVSHYRSVTCGILNRLRPLCPRFSKGEQLPVVASLCIHQCVVSVRKVLTTALGYLCHRARVHCSPYEAYPSLYCRDNRYYVLGVGTIPSFFSAQLMLMS